MNVQNANWLRRYFKWNDMKMDCVVKNVEIFQFELECMNKLKFKIARLFHRERSKMMENHSMNCSIIC